MSPRLRIFILFTLVAAVAATAWMLRLALSVTGSRVRDVPNACNERHPVWFSQVLSGRTGSC